MPTVPVFELTVLVQPKQVDAEGVASQCVTVDPARPVQNSRLVVPKYVAADQVALSLGPRPLASVVKVAPPAVALPEAANV